MPQQWEIRSIGEGLSSMRQPPFFPLSPSFVRGSSIVVGMRVFFVPCINAIDAFEVPFVVS